jgi:hypothetical protein
MVESAAGHWMYFQSFTHGRAATGFMSLLARAVPGTAKTHAIVNRLKTPWDSCQRA